MLAGANAAAIIIFNIHVVDYQALATSLLIISDKMSSLLAGLTLLSDVVSTKAMRPPSKRPILLAASNFTKL